ncbi:MAG: adenylate/guanylate cyclase domain-containing protein [Nitrosopumilus sp.]|nr:adenylate/guanylate cyclase domain-containing protein [Nitrosopumilus sp.]
MWNGQSTVNETSQRVKELDANRLEIDQRSGRVFPDIEKMRIGEAREFTLSVLHIDVVGYTGLMSKLTNSGKLRFMNSFLSEMGQTVREYSGNVEKFVGDKVTALFGIGESSELGAKHCIDCALTMLTKIKYAINPHLQQIGIEPFSCSVGVDFGTTWIARTGITNSTQFSLVGNTVNVASQLEEAASSNEILLGGAFYNELSNHEHNFCSRITLSNWGWTWGNEHESYPVYKYTGHWPDYPLR